MRTIIDMRPNQKFVDPLINLIDLVYAKKNDKLNMIEVGSYQGQSMEIFVKTGKLKTIVCIDPWKNDFNKKDCATLTSDMAKVESMFDERANNLSDYDTNIIKHKGTLDTFIKSVEYNNNCNSFDLVYIDACHSYEACKHDINVTKNVIIPKIAICGHDYSDGWPGVKHAVNEILEKPDCTFIDNSWIKFAKNIYQK